MRHGFGRARVKVWDRAKVLGLADIFALIALSVSSITLSLTTIVRRPDLVRGAEFLFFDTGHNLLVADRLLTGHSLYRDIFYPYSPLSPYIYTGWAYLFGNTPATYLLLLAAISAVNICLASRLVRRASAPPTAALTSIGLLALLPVPGAIAGGFTVSPYLVLERTLLLVV